MEKPLATKVMVDAASLMSAQHFAKWLKLKGSSEFDAFLELPREKQLVARSTLVRLAMLARAATLGEADSDYFGDRRLIPLAEELERYSVLPR